MLDISGAIIVVNCVLIIDVPSLPQACEQTAAPSKPPHPTQGGRRRRRRSDGAGRGGGGGGGGGWQRCSRQETTVKVAVALALSAQSAGHGGRRVAKQGSDFAEWTTIERPAFPNSHFEYVIPLGIEDSSRLEAF